ncbi:MAG: phospho-N-acetylmuramoyl-pentapeptide-transferase, partial [Puniceicoccales bacterium]|nr:phospho-N-acetylmuramoyl-pentapeptide-transferase [Puniceicoccales bacterium]
MLTMGGVAIFLSAMIPIIFLVKFNLYVILALFVCVALGLLGFIDDFLKLSKKNVKGISGRKKLAIQLAVSAVVFVVLCRFHERDIVEMLPFFGWCPKWIFTLIAFPFVFFVLAGTSNTVNLADGLDGLASVCVIPNFIFFAAAACISGSGSISSFCGFVYLPGTGDLAVILSCFCGALLVFLWYNAHPASIMMGDTGSLMLGGLLAA